MIVFQDRLHRQIAEQIDDIPALPDVAELAFKVFSQDRVQQRGVEPEVPETVFLAGDWWDAKMEGGREKLAVKGGVTGTASGLLNPDMMADCWPAVSWRLVSSVACRSGNAGRRLCPRVACRRGTTSCMAGNDSRR